MTAGFREDLNKAGIVEDVRRLPAAGVLKKGEKEENEKKEMIRPTLRAVSCLVLPFAVPGFTHTTTGSS
jgi:hypothetical protein